MKNRLILAALVMLLVAAVLPTSAQQSKGSQIISKFQYSDIKWSIPEVGKDVQRTELDNGIILYLMEDHRLPIMDISALTHCGSAYLPIEQMAVPDLTGTVIRSGGTVQIPADSLNTLLESIGASLETSIGGESGQATLSMMAKDVDLGIRLLADVLRHPAFPEDKIDLAKEQIKTNIKRRNDDPGSIQSREFAHLLYGDHPNGRILEWAYIKPVTRQDLVAYHDRHYAPNNLMLGITGDFDPAQVLALIKQYFGDWQKKDIALPPIPPVDSASRPGVFLVFKDINQANIRFGHLGITRDNPDRYAIQVMNYILGGGSFTSRMTTKVRSDEGLSYSVNSRFDTDSRDLGTFSASCLTKSGSAYKALSLMLAEVERIRTAPVDDEELASAKDSYINRYVFDFTSAGRIVNRLMSLEFDNRPRDLLKTYLDNIRKVTKEDVLRVARTYLQPDKLSIMVVGKPEDFEKPLDAFGKVTTIELQAPVIE